VLLILEGNSFQGCFPNPDASFGPGQCNVLGSIFYCLCDAPASCTKENCNTECNADDSSGVVIGLSVTLSILLVVIIIVVYVVFSTRQKSELSMSFIPQ